MLCLHLDAVASIFSEIFIIICFFTISRVKLALFILHLKGLEKS